MAMKNRSGFTLAEILLGGVVLAVAAASILGAYVGQVTLNEHARNLSLAIHDANRVIERMRQENSGVCNPVDIVPPSGATWDAWLGTVAAGGGKSIGINAVAAQTNELISVTCQDRDGGALASDYCRSNVAAPGAQIAAGEWQADNSNGVMDPLRVTVAVCWRHRNRIIGECAPNGAALQAADNGGSGVHNITGVIESPAMLTTLITCRG